MPSPIHCASGAMVAMPCSTSETSKAKECNKRQWDELLWHLESTTWPRPSKSCPPGLAQLCLHRCLAADTPRWWPLAPDQHGEKSRGQRSCRGRARSCSRRMGVSRGAGTAHRAPGGHGLKEQMCPQGATARGLLCLPGSLQPPGGSPKRPAEDEAAKGCWQNSRDSCQPHGAPSHAQPRRLPLGLAASGGDAGCCLTTSRSSRAGVQPMYPGAPTPAAFGRRKGTVKAQQQWHPWACSTVPTQGDSVAAPASGKCAPGINHVQMGPSPPESCELSPPDGHSPRGGGRVLCPSLAPLNCILTWLQVVWGQKHSSSHSEGCREQLLCWCIPEEAVLSCLGSCRAP